MSESGLADEKDLQGHPWDGFLGPFLDQLSVRFQFRVSLRQREVARRVLSVPRLTTNLQTLRTALVSVLCHEEAQRTRFLRHFDEFFRESLEIKAFEDLAEEELGAAFRNLSKLARDPHRPQPVEGVGNLDEKRKEPEWGEEVPRPKPVVISNPAQRPARIRPQLHTMQTIPWPGELDDEKELQRVERWQPPVDLKIDEAHPERQWFSLRQVGSQDRRILDSNALDQMADSLSQFSRHCRREELDTARSIAASIDHGVPMLVLERGFETGRVLILEDRGGGEDWNSFPREFEEGLRIRGLTVERSKFDGVPDQFVGDNGHWCWLEELEGDREDIFLILATNGEHLLSSRDHTVLEELRQWPHKAWLNPRERTFWHPEFRRFTDLEIPVFEANSGGLRELAVAQVSELEGFPESSWPVAPGHLDAILGVDAEDWAIACAILPRISLEIAESLRRTFFAKQVGPEAIGRFFYLPGMRWDGQALEFRPDVQGILLDRAQKKFDDPQWDRIHAHLIECFDTALGQLAGYRDVIPAHQTLAWVTCRWYGLMLRLRRPMLDDGERHQVIEELERWFGDGSPYRAYFQYQVAGNSMRTLEWNRLPQEDRDVLRKLFPDSTGNAPGKLPPDFVIIPGGPFRMGDGTGEGYPDETPEHEVELSEYAMGRHPVTNGEWDRVRSWAIRNGYRLDTEGDAEKVDHPVVNVSWYEAVVWCNARSEMEGRRPAYYTGPDRQTVCRSGDIDVDDAAVEWDGDGYRLPTEAEWERAARGGKDGHHYPWESRGKGYDRFIRRELANYNHNEGGTTPVNKYPANEYGLHDMAGNVWEWCWDRWDAKWYSNPTASKPNPRGPSKEAFRVFRGGSWAFSAGDARCAFRNGSPPSNRNVNQGFRLSLGAAGLGLKAGATEARRDDERKERRRQTESLGCLVVRVPRVPGVQLRGHGPKGGQSLEVERPQGLAVGRWKIVCEAPGYQPTELEVEVREGEAHALALRLEREIPKGFEWIPAGTFWMGDPTEEGYDDERPRHEVEVSEFWMGNFPVTNAEWAEVRAWALQHGYELKAEEDSRKPDHPIVNVDWYEAVRWCNARSEKEGRRPVYYAGPLDSKPEVLRRGTGELSNTWVDWAADGYRLPTEAEWEKAARGGRGGHHYPWESQGKGHERFITKELANYDGNKGGTTPLGRYRPNDYGLHDMAGNVWEWCWDRWDSGWYANPAAQELNPHGPPNGTEEAYRVYRGGGWATSARDARCAYRSGYLPSLRGENRGFRLSLGHLGQAEPAAGGPEVRRDDEPTHPMSGGAVGPTSAANQAGKGRKS